jgi:hypothetical protein
MIKLSVPSFDIDEIKTKTNRRQKIANRLNQCPAIAGLKITSQLPIREAEKENYRGSDKDPVGGNQSHKSIETPRPRQLQET